MLLEPRPADPQGRAQPAQPLPLCRSALRDHRQHQAGRARVHPAAGQPDRQPGRGHAAPRHRSRADQPRDQAARGDGRRRVQRNPDQHGAGGDLADEVQVPTARERRTRTRRRRHRTGAEGRISHLKRRYGLRGSRLKGAPPRSVWGGSRLPTRRLRSASNRPSSLQLPRTASPRDWVPPHAPLDASLCSANAPKGRTAGIEKAASRWGRAPRRRPSQQIATLRADILRRRALPTQIVEEPSKATTATRSGTDGRPSPTTPTPTPPSRCRTGGERGLPLLAHRHFYSVAKPSPFWP